MIKQLNLNHVDLIYKIIEQTTKQYKDEYCESDLKALLKSNTMTKIIDAMKSKEFYNYWYFLNWNLVGFITLNPSEQWLYRIFVSWSVQWKWIWKELLNFAKQEIKRFWKKSMHLYARKNAVGFYEFQWFVYIENYSWDIDGHIVVLKKMEIKL